MSQKKNNTHNGDKNNTCIRHFQEHFYSRRQPVSEFPVWYVHITLTQHILSVIVVLLCKSMIRLNLPGRCVCQNPDILTLRYILTHRWTLNVFLKMAYTL